jgi:hypothetical protein
LQADFGVGWWERVGLVGIRSRSGLAFCVHVRGVRVDFGVSGVSGCMGVGSVGFGDLRDACFLKMAGPIHIFR